MTFKLSRDGWKGKNCLLDVPKLKLVHSQQKFELHSFSEDFQCVIIDKCHYLHFLNTCSVISRTKNYLKSLWGVHLIAILKNFNLGRGEIHRDTGSLLLPRETSAIGSGQHGVQAVIVMQMEASQSEGPVLGMKHLARFQNGSFSRC